MGTLSVSVMLIILVACIIRSLIKAKRTGRHPSCGGNCASCGHCCSAPHAASPLKKFP